MKFLQKILLIFLFTLSSIFVYGCHDVSFTEVSATDNGDGTYSYTFEICLGSGEDGTADATYGFYLDFDGGNLLDYPNDVTGPSTGNVKIASVPPISGVGDIEYGDWDDDGTSVLSGANNDCILVTFKFDSPITSATLGGYQPNYCAGDTQMETTTSCFPSTANYTVEITTYSCNSDNVSWGLDGATIVSNIPTDGTTRSWIYCGGCADVFSIDAPSKGGNCDGGVASYSVEDASGNEIASGGGDNQISYSDDVSDVNCTVLPVENGKSSVIYDEFKKANRISWSTLSEKNNDYFTLFYSNDGIEWNEIQRISGAGNSNVRMEYETYHRSFKKNNINYYKIIQTDFDGAFETLTVLSVDNSSEKKVVKILNMMGQEVGENYNGILIRYYSDGSTEKVYSK